MMESIICPVCKQLDRIEKVSTIIHTGTATGRVTGTNLNIGSAGGHLMISRGIIGMTSTQKTLLSSLLSPPRHPSVTIPHRGGGWWMVGIVFSAIFLGITFLIGLSVAILSWVSLNQLSATFVLSNLFFVIILPAIFLASLIFCIIGIQRVGKARLAAIAAQEPRWREAMQHWSMLYYCYRDDILFMPGSPDQYAPIKMMYKLL